MRGLAYLSGVCLFASTISANALTAAQLLQSDSRFAEGFVWGMANYRSFVAGVGPNDSASARKFSQCLYKAGITSGTLRDAALQYIRNHPETLTEAAVGPVLRSLIEICPDTEEAD